MAFVWHPRTVCKCYLDLSDILADKTDMLSIEFNANHFLDEHVGPGQQAVLALFQNAGLPDADMPSYDMVRKWRTRGSMPAEWLARVLLAKEMLGDPPLSMRAYFSRSNPRPDCSGSLPSVFD